SRPTHCRDKEGNLIGYETEKQKRWQGYFKEMLNEGAESYEEQQKLGSYSMNENEEGRQWKQ
ncbi:hypothetical protein ILUMI_14819, partial [Ignelater luminosus]